VGGIDKQRLSRKTSGTTKTRRQLRRSYIIVDKSFQNQAQKKHKWWFLKMQIKSIKKRKSTKTSVL
jgi:hypothetical protein